MKCKHNKRKVVWNYERPGGSVRVFISRCLDCGKEFKSWQFTNRVCTSVIEEVRS